MQIHSLAIVVRALAKVGSIASLGFVSMFFIAHLVQGEFSPIEWHECLALLFFPIGVMSGMLLGWWKEALGGWLTVGSLIAFYIWNLIVSGQLPGGPYFILLSLPGLMFLVTSLLDSKSNGSTVLAQSTSGNH